MLLICYPLYLPKQVTQSGIHVTLKLYRCLSSKDTVLWRTRRHRILLFDICSNYKRQTTPNCDRLSNPCLVDTIIRLKGYVYLPDVPSLPLNIEHLKAETLAINYYDLSPLVFCDIG